MKTCDALKSLSAANAGGAMSEEGSEVPAFMGNFKCPRNAVAYKNFAVLERYRKDLLLTRSESELLFSDVKKFLWLSSIVKEPIAPPPKIDEGWHLFLLFTEDYRDFCESRLGSFIHHRPHRPCDRPDGGQAVRNMVAAVETYFGGFKGMSPNWLFPGMTANNCWGGSCSSDSTSCAPSPSCSS